MLWRANRFLLEWAKGYGVFKCVNAENVTSARSYPIVPTILYSAFAQGSQCRQSAVFAEPEPVVRRRRVHSAFLQTKDG